MQKIGAIENGVLIGKDGYLFLAGGAHRVFDIVARKAPISHASFQIFRSNISARMNWAQTNKAKFVHIIMPDKQSIIPHQWPIEPPLMMGLEYLSQCEELSNSIMYPAAQLSEHSPRSVSQVDTHLTDYGSILVAKELVERLSNSSHAALSNELASRIVNPVCHSGDLGSKLTPPVFAAEYRFDAPQPGPSFSNHLAGGNNGLIDLRFNFNAPIESRLVVFGDSFGRELSRYLQFWYRQVFFFRTGYFHEEIASLCRPDILITENVERYMDNCRPDDERPHFLLYPFLQPLRDNLLPPDSTEALSAVLNYPRKPYQDFIMKVSKLERSDNNRPVAPFTVMDVNEVALIDCSRSPRLLKALEEPKLVPQRMPDFIENFSDSEIQPWLQKDQNIHGSYLVRREKVVLFGPNHLVSASGEWSCESQSFKSQFISLVESPSYETIFPGPKPTFRRGEQCTIKTDHLVSSPIEEIRTPVFLATPLEPDNWGRWLATVIPKAMHYREYGAGRQFFCRTKYPWQKAVLRSIGVEADKVLEHDPGQTYLCHDVMTVEYSATSMTVSALEQREYQRLASEFRGKGNTFRKIFVSRLSQSKRHPNYRVLQNESELSDRLLEQGFNVVEPESLPFEEQVSLFHAADMVVCLGGAALYNIVFCKPETKVVTIESSDNFIVPHSNLISSLDLRFGIIFGKQDALDPAPSHKRWTVDVDRVASCIKRFAEN